MWTLTLCGPVGLPVGQGPLRLDGRSRNRSRASTIHPITTRGRVRSPPPPTDPPGLGTEHKTHFCTITCDTHKCIWFENMFEYSCSSTWQNMKIKKLKDLKGDLNDATKSILKSDVRCSQSTMICDIEHTNGLVWVSLRTCHTYIPVGILCLCSRTETAWAERQIIKKRNKVDGIERKKKKIPSLQYLND